MRILVADDDSISKCMLTAVLQDWGYEVVTVEDGDEAWEVLQSDQVPRLALLDWMMPGLTGPALCRNLRQRELAEPPYVILLTARGERKDIIEGLEAGANDYISKPYDYDELRARLNVGQRMLTIQSALVGQGKLQGILEMATAVCHELNQPLQVVSMYSEMLLDTVPEADPSHLTLESMHEAVELVATLTRKIMQVCTYRTDDYLRGKMVDIHRASEQAA